MSTRRPVRTRQLMNRLVPVLVVLIVAASLATWGPRPHSLGSDVNPQLWTTSGAASPCGWAWAPPATQWVPMPDGATRMWICDGVERNPVTEGIQAVVAQVSAHYSDEPRQPGDKCPAPGSTGTVFLDYPNGTRVGFRWDTACHEGAVAGYARPDAAAAAIRAAYEAQYGPADADADDDPNPCRPRQFTQIVSPINTLGSLTLCRGTLDAAHGAAATTPVPLTPGDQVQVLAGLTWPSLPEQKKRLRTQPPPDAVLLRGVYPQGLLPNTATLWWSGKRVWVSGPETTVWDLNTPARKILERYLNGTQASVQPTPGSRAAAGANPCAAPPEPSNPRKLPNGPVAAWLCTNDGDELVGSSPPDPLTLDPQALVDVYAQLPTKWPFDDCLESDDKSYRLVLRYPDRGDVTVEANSIGCRQVGSRKDATRGLLIAYWTLLAHQRQTVPAPGVDPTTFCTQPLATGVWARHAQPTLLMRVDQATSLVRCRGTTSHPLPGWLLTDLRAHYGIVRDTFFRSGPTVQLFVLAPDGSSVSIEWDGTSGWFQLNDQWYQWRPSPQAEAALNRDDP